MKLTLSTGASREASVDNACFSGILPFSGLCALAYPTPHPHKTHPCEVANTLFKRPCKILCGEPRSKKPRIGLHRKVVITHNFFVGPMTAKRKSARPRAGRKQAAILRACHKYMFFHAQHSQSLSYSQAYARNCSPT